MSKKDYKDIAERLYGLLIQLNNEDDNKSLAMEEELPKVFKKYSFLNNPKYRLF